MAGVLGPLPGVIGAMMAVETIKLIALAGTALHSEMLIYDGLYGESRKLALKPRADCPVCGCGTPKPEPHNSSAQILNSGSAE
jgi:molybdopterin/thiamine biosynthesis adenylyltransferase